MVVRRILVATDLSAESEHAVRYGYLLAQRLQAEVALLHVHGDNASSLSRDPSSATDASDPATRLLDDLSAMATQCAAQGVCTRVIVRMGREGPAVLATARELPAELIVLGSHQLHGIEHALFASEHDERFREKSCPVIVVPAPHGEAAS